MRTIAIFMLLIMTACSDTKTKNRNGSFDLAEHFNEICGFELPSSIKIIHEFDNGEGQAEALYSIDKKDLEIFITQNKFVSLDTLLFPADGILMERKAEILARYDLKMNDEKKYKLENYSNLIAFQKCKNKNSFTLIADKSSKLLWLIIQYPDMAGDGPNCE